MTRPARRVLVLANGDCDGVELAAALRARIASTRADVLVVAPALNSRLRHWLSDEDEARRQAEDRVLHYVAQLRLDGFATEGMIGDPDPVQAIADALALFAADAVVIAADGDRVPNRLARDLEERARRRFGVPVVQARVAHAGLRDAA
jgi:siroheme synthase (precorrin-2 oxidase/ferrochelatase)